MDVTGQGQAGESVERSAEWFRTLADTVPTGIMIVRDGKISYANKAAVTMSGYGIAELDSIRFIDLVQSDHRETVEARLRALLNGEAAPTHDEVRFLTNSGGVRWTDCSYTLMEYEGKSAILITTIEISERKIADQLLQTSEKRFRALVENSFEAFALLDTSGRMIYQSPSFFRITGYTLDDLQYGGIFTKLHPEESLAFRSAFDELINMPERTMADVIRVKNRDGAFRYLECVAINLLQDPAVRAIVINFHDITRHKHVEAALQQALDEKEVLMNELQHRVKNSLNTAISMINLERKNLPDEKSRAVFTATAIRLNTMATLYEQLNQTGRADRIDLSVYLRTLTERLANSYLAPGSGIRIESELRSVELEPKRAMSVGMIVNELVTNALKHAFPGRHGAINVELTSDGGDISVCVSDDGIGLIPGTKKAGGSGLGLMLVEMLVDQLDGNLTFEGGNGVTVCVTFADS